MKQFTEKIVMILRDEICKRLSEIPQKLFASFAALYDAAGENRKPLSHVIAATPRKFRRQILCPVRATRLETVGDHILQPAFSHQSAGRVFILIEVIFKVRFDRVWI